METRINEIVTNDSCNRIQVLSRRDPLTCSLIGMPFNP